MNTVIVNGVNITEQLEKYRELYNKQTELLELYRNLSMETRFELVRLGTNKIELELE